MRTVEPGVTVFTCAENRVALIPAGNVPKDVMVDYCELLESYRHVELLSARSFYHERQKSPLKHLQWGQGAMHFSFVQGDKALQATPMTALHGCRSIVGVIGICHCPHAPDISEAYADFEKMAQQFPSAVALRCFAFEPLEDEVNKDNLQKEFLIMFPPGDRSQVEQHLEVLMHDFAACVLMGLQQQMLNKSISEMKLQTYVDLPDFSGYMSVEDARQKLGSEEEVKHRRRHTRLEKLLADLSMLAGSPGDAAEHYNTCIELSKMCGDSVWGAAALEGMAEAKVLQALLDGDGLPRSRSKAALYKESSREAEIPDSPESPMSRAMRETSTCGFGGVSLWKVLKATRNLEQQVRGYYMQAYQTYQKRGIVPLQIEVELKRARFVAGLYGHRARGEASDLLTQVMEQWPQLALEEDRVNVAVEAAQVLGMVGAVRKRAWLIWQALEMVRTLQRDDSTLLKMALKSLEPPGDPENQDMRSSRPGQWSLSKCALPHRHWASLHKATLEALLSAASKAGEFVYVWEAAAALLRGHHTVIAQEHQHMLLEALVHAAEHMDAAAKRRPGPGPPPLFQVRNFVPLAVELVAAKVMTSWQSSDKGVEGNGPFIFNPFGKREQAQKEEVPQWIVGEECSLEVYIANPCAIQLKVDRLSLSAEAMEVPEGNGASVKVAQPVPVAVVLPGRTKPTRVTLALIPLVTGTFHIVGCNVTVFGVTWQQRFVSTLRNVPLGPGLQTVENQVDGEQHIVAAVEVLPAMPLLKASISRVGKSGSQIQVHDVPPCGNQHSDGRVKTVVYEGQHFTFVLQLRNHSKLPVLSARIAVQDSYNAAAGDGKGAMKPGVRLRVDEGVMQSSLPLTPDQVVKVPVLVEVGQPLSVSQERASMVETQIKVMYSGSAAEESHGQKLVGRELCIPITFCVEPAVRVVSVSLVEQYVPAAVDRGGPAGRHYDPTYSGEEAASGGSVGTLKAGMSSLESITGPPVLLQQRSGVSEVSAGKEDTSQGWPPTDGDLPPSAQNSMSTGEKRVEKQLLIAELQPQCVLQLEVSNRGDRAFDVCLGKSQQERTEGDKDKALMSPLSVGPSQSVRLQHTLPSFPAELLASFSGQEQKQAPPPGRGPPQTVNQPVADWICSTVAVLWSAATALPTSDEPEVETKTPASGQTDTAEFADLTPLGELNGLIPLRVDSVLRALTTQVLALIAECSVFLYICPSAGRSPLRFADLRKVVPNEGLMTWRGATPLELFPGWGRSPAVDTRESADGEEMNLEVDIDQAADVDLGPTGPNGEVWGTQVGMGELLDCDIVVANRSSRTRQLVVSVCCDCLWMLGETQGPVAFGTASELVHPGVVLVGRMRKVPVEVPANTRVVHRFSVCCACPGVYQLYAVDEEPQDYPGSESGRTVSVDDFIGSVQGFRLNVLCMDPGLER